ncbi:lipopolysaccharide biosynthesis protein [Ruegeria sp.]|uniref:lipopolysaccharide biosynthesis protein n=1 Tax=Ruegeria sp. TaxID=1879320 RepID=UPI003C7A1BB2
MSLERKFANGVAWMSAGSWIEQAINFAVFALLARLLGVEAFGILAMAAAFVLLLEFLVRESVSEILLTNDALSTERLNSVFWLMVVFGFGLAGLLLVASGPIADFYKEEQVAPLIIALSPTVPMIALTAVPVALLRREMQFRALALRAVAGVIAGGVVGIGMALSGFGVWSLAGQRVTQVAVNVVMAWAAVSWRPGLHISSTHVREVLHFGHRMVGLRAAELVAVQMPSVIIGASLGPTQAGLYSIAWRVIEIASFLVTTPLRMVTLPAIGNVMRQGAAAPKLLQDIMRMTGLVVFPAFAGLAVLAEPALTVLFGPKWVPAAPVLSIMCLFGVYLCIDKVQQTYCLAAGRVGVLATLAWCEVALGIVLIYFAIPFGLTASAIAFVAAFLLMWPLRFRNLASIAGVHTASLISPHVAPLILAAIMASGVYVVSRQMADVSGIVVLLAGTVFGLVLFAGLAFLCLRDRLELLRSFVRPQTEAPENSA